MSLKLNFVVEAWNLLANIGRVHKSLKTQIKIQFHTPSENRVYLRNGTLNEPGTSLSIWVFPLWSSRKKPERSICLGFVLAARQSLLGSKFSNLKILNFLLVPQNFTANQCSYAKEMRWIWPKMTKLEPISWTMSKFPIFNDVKIQHDFKSLIYTGAF